MNMSHRLALLSARRALIAYRLSLIGGESSLAYLLPLGLRRVIQFAVARCARRGAPASAHLLVVGGPSNERRATSQVPERALFGARGELVLAGGTTCGLHLPKITTFQ